MREGRTLVSLLDYVKLSGDAQAQGFTAKLTTASRALLDFDRGCWSLYSLGGSRASLHYHEYHIALLKQLSAKTGDPFWRNKALFWEGCLPGH
jgi:D-glucuronyl C5-epimerase C-terminus